MFHVFHNYIHRQPGSILSYTSGGDGLDTVVEDLQQAVWKRGQKSLQNIIKILKNHQAIWVECTEVFKAVYFNMAKQN